MIPIIDIHPHVISADLARYPTSPLAGIRSDWSEARSNDIEDYIGAMAEAGIVKAAIVQSATTYGYNNHCVADAISRHPDLLTGVCSIDMLGEDGPGRLRALHAQGFTGMRIFVKGSTIKTPLHDLDGPRSIPVWETAAELGMSVVTNMPTEGVWREQVVSILKRFPTVRLIMDHLSRPPGEDGPPYKAAEEFFKLADYPNLYLKATPLVFGFLRKGQGSPETFMQRLVSVFGAQRIAWGSNYPSAEGSLRDIAQEARDVLSLLAARDQELILNGTAKILYPALASS